MSAQNKNTVVVNLFGGPAAGKTTCAWEIASKLKKLRLVTEYVPEYAKELVWDENYSLLDGSLEHQHHIFEVQTHRVERLIGKVDVIVTDATLLNSLVYGKNNPPHFEREVLDNFRRFRNVNIFIRRGDYFEQEGRVHTLEESLALDRFILELLVSHAIPFHCHNHLTIDRILPYIAQQTQTK